MNFTTYLCIQSIILSQFLNLGFHLQGFLLFCGLPVLKLIVGSAYPDINTHAIARNGNKKSFLIVVYMFKNLNINTILLPHPHK